MYNIRLYTTGRTAGPKTIQQSIVVNVSTLPHGRRGEVVLVGDSCGACRSMGTELRAGLLRRRGCRHADLDRKWSDLSISESLTFRDQESGQSRERVWRSHVSLMHPLSVPGASKRRSGGLGFWTFLFFSVRVCSSDASCRYLNLHKLLRHEWVLPAHSKSPRRSSSRCVPVTGAHQCAPLIRTGFLQSER